MCPTPNALFLIKEMGVLHTRVGGQLPRVGGVPGHSQMCLLGTFLVCVETLGFVAFHRPLFPTAFLVSAFEFFLPFPSLPVSVCHYEVDLLNALCPAEGVPCTGHVHVLIC